MLRRYILLPYQKTASTEIHFFKPLSAELVCDDGPQQHSPNSRAKVAVVKEAYF